MVAETLKDFRWIGLHDHLEKIYDGWAYSKIAALVPLPDTFSFGYRKAHAVEDCFALLYEAVNYATRWEDSALVLFTLDAQAAFEAVQHDVHTY